MKRKWGHELFLQIIKTHRVSRVLISKQELEVSKKKTFAKFNSYVYKVETMEEEHLFYGKVIHRQREQEYIQSIIQKYNKGEANEETKKKVYEELMMAQFEGLIHIPFEVNLVKDPFKRYPDYIEVTLDTRV